MDVGGWLRGLGLERYEEKFRDNNIDLDVLPQLTADDLKDLGVAAVGDRRRLLAAIAALAEMTPSAATSGAETKARPVPEALAERRQLTVMFCDLVGSTRLSSRLDPEDMREIVGAYHRCCATQIANSGGFISKYMGDGVLAYFGYPQAHEHDAERAVRAGLAIVDAAPKLETAAGAPLHVRVGIATGIVVVGDLLGSGESQERGVVGDTPNLAARLQGIAGPDTVVIAEGTRKLLGDLFELVDLGPQDLKGVAGPTRAHAALRPSSQESRFEALHAGGLTALVGRDEELELLLRLWAKASAGAGQVALLSGEAGIGKSRLSAALLERLANEPHVRLRYFCSPQHMDSALYPIIGHMERAAGLAREDDTKTKLDKLDALLAMSATSREDAALLAEMLSLLNDGRYPALELTPQQRRQKTMEALIGQIEVISRQSPVLMIFEDAHWADPSSVEVLGRLVDKIEALRVFLVVISRAEFVTPWIGRPHVSALTINRLAHREVLALIDQVAGERRLAANIRQDIVERTDGIPLFAEEMTKAVLEVEGEDAAVSAVAAVPSPALAVPASLHASLMARLDRLGSAKAVAQVGAAIGREFSHGLLAPVARLPEQELNSQLDRLLQSGLMSRQGVPPHATYFFKHALVQDAAYGTLLREPRRALHASIAEVLESQFPDFVETQPELLARHCTQAGLIEKAAALWGKAGQRSLARSALVEAEAQLTRALSQIAALSSTPALRREQTKLQVGLTNALMLTKGYAASETKASLEQARTLIERAEALGEPTEDPLALFSVLYGFWAGTYLVFKGDALCGLAAQFLALAGKQTATAPLTIGHRVVGVSLLLTGDFAGGRAHLDRAIALYNPAEHRPLTTRFGLQDAGVAMLSLRSLAMWLLGYPDAAKTDVERALSDAREIGHVATLLFALLMTTITQMLLGDNLAIRIQAQEALALADEKKALLWQAVGTVMQCLGLLLFEKTSIAVSSLTQAISIYRSTGATVHVVFMQSYLGMAHAALGQFEEGRICNDEAMILAERTGERWFDAEISRVAGEMELLSPGRDAAKAQTYFERALEIARAQQAHSWELRAATSLARLWRELGRRTEAVDLLAPIYGWFTEGFDTRDLKEAKTMLDALAS